jgi:acetylornithine deacetylase/succinyl-diaminopimelate desuccinylase-like protein
VSKVSPDTMPPPSGADEVVGLASDLIRINTSNTGEPRPATPERPAAEYVAAKLAEAGYDPAYVESGAPGRGNVIARLPGSDPTAGALLVHAHLDVVPADAAEWAVHPFSGEVRDGFLWGRGAVDMKGMAAMILAAARQLKRGAIVPRRDLIFAFLADEEAGGFHGSRWLAAHRRELFTGATEAIGEVGGTAEIIGATLRDTANVTVFNAGSTANVVPSTATAEVDVRFLPGREKIIQRELLEILGPGIEASWPPAGGDRRQVIPGARHPALRLLAVAPAAGPGLRRAVSRRRRARSRRRPAIRYPGPNAPAAPLLNPLLASPPPRAPAG